MKLEKTLICLAALAMPSIGLIAQAVNYEYDASGNRVKRSVIATKSVTADSALLHETVSDSIDMYETNDFDLIIPSDTANTNDETLNVRVYPNPTSGILDVEIDNLRENRRARLEIYTFSGHCVRRIDKLQSLQSLDISNQPAGIYLFRIAVDEKAATLKIIKL
jgi:hypothetical protein